MRYTSPDEARSDLFLSAAVYLFGPLVLGLVLRIIPLDRIPGVGVALQIALPLVTTVLVPYLLIRYRKESLKDYAPSGGRNAFTVGLLLAVPIVVAALLAALLEQNPLEAALPVLQIAQPGGDGALFIAVRLALWLGLAGLAAYATVKARDAFRTDPQTIRDGTLEIGRVVGIIAVVTVLLLLIATPADLANLVLVPLGVAAAVLLGLRQLRGPSATSRATLLTPVILLAIGPFLLSFNALRFVQGLYAAALLGGIGLLIGMLQETRHSAYGAIGLALALALASPLLPIQGG